MLFRSSVSDGRWRTEASLEELALLARTAGAKVVKTTLQRLPAINPKTYIGQGKLAEIVAEQAETGYTTVIFDDELSPSQQRNLEKALDAKELIKFEREAMLGVMAPVLAEAAPECFSAIFGRGLEDCVAAARVAVELDHADKRRVLAHVRTATAPRVTGSSSFSS